MDIPTTRAPAEDTMTALRKALARLSTLTALAQDTSEKLETQLTEQFKKVVSKQADNANSSGWHSLLGIPSGLFQMVGDKGKGVSHAIEAIKGGFFDASTNKSNTLLKGDEQLLLQNRAKTQQISEAFRNCMNNAWSAYQQMQNTTAQESKV